MSDFLDHLRKGLMTAQVSETLIYEGKPMPLCSNPLSLYLQQSQIRFVSPSTANWRGYRGTWEIKPSKLDGLERLYLTKLVAYRTHEDILSLRDVFPGFNQVFAHWFSGELRCPQGELLKYVHGGYASTYEYDLLMNFKQGVLVEKHVRHNSIPQDRLDSGITSLLRGEISD